MRKQLFILFFIFCAFVSHAQIKNPLAKTIPSVKPDIEKVARDYYSHFYNTKGDKLKEDETTIEYESKVKPQGADRCLVTKYKSEENDYSWQAEMLSTDDYVKAVAKYKQLYNQLNGSVFAMHDGKSYKIKGRYDAPDEGRGFASSLLQLDVVDKDLRRLKIEVALNYFMPQWSIRILVYEKDDDDDMRPTQKSGR
jgi:hypothetical protein